MLRGGLQASTQDKQQKQKKKLSFKDPEIEGPQKLSSSYTGFRSKTLSRPTKISNTKKTSSSLEDLTLEDEALLIAQSVGSAFSNLSVTDDNDIFSPGPSVRETEIIESPSNDFPVHSRNCQNSLKLSPEDEEFLDSLNLPSTERFDMRGPNTDASEPSAPKNCIPVELPHNNSWTSSSAQHQIQLLKYQLDQQNQQTQMAIHQIQLLQNQMEAESNARRKAQEQNNQLLQQNRDLLNHMEKLFQQIEDLEKQMHILQQERFSVKAPYSQETQASPFRQAPFSSNTRRPSTDQEKATPIPIRSSYTAARRNSLTSSKPAAINTKPTTNQGLANRKSSTVTPKSSVQQNKNADLGAKPKETLRIGDISPPVQSGISNPFSSNWKSKLPDTSVQLSDDKTNTMARSRTSSLSSFNKKTEDKNSPKTSLFGSNSLSTNTSTKKHSSSTSDLYNSSGTSQSKPLVIDEPSDGIKSSVSNLSLSSSRLPRYQPYTGWQRRSSLANDNEQAAKTTKNDFRNVQKSIFNS